MKPEVKTEIVLWNWLKTESEFTKEIYFNRKNIISAPIFKIIGVMEKPDFILKIDNGYGIKYAVLEIKDSSSSLNVLKGSKVIDKYFKNYIEKKTEYLIDNKKININYFLIATQSSVKGHLFKKEKIISNLEDKESESKYAAASKYKIIPINEGHRTFEYVRILWDTYGKIRNNYEEKCGLGILMGNSEDNFTPWIMITDYYEKKKRWSQRWWKI